MNTLQRIKPNPGKKQEKEQKPISLKERFKGCFPEDLNALMYALFILVYLSCAIIHFAHAGDANMLTALLPYLSAYTGMHKVAHLFPWSKGEDQRQN